MSMTKAKAGLVLPLFAALLIAIILIYSGKLEIGRKTGDNKRDAAAVGAAAAGKSDGFPVWTLGKPDDSGREFGGNDARLTVIDADAATSPADWRAVPGGLNKSVNADFVIRYRLDKIPAYGVLLETKVIDAHKSIPQMAVFSNRQLSGIVQIAGVGGTASAFSYQKTYRLYIPPEQLKAGVNELKLQAIGCLYCSSSEDAYLWWNWDYLSLNRLTQPVDEPIHGRYIASGTSVNANAFYYDEAAVRYLPYVLKWLGIAYSGNIMRTGCATDVKDACSNIKAYYETLGDYNTQAVSFHLHTGNIKLKADGSLPDDAAEKMREYLQNYGDLFQYYEVDNEPGLFNRSKKVNLALAAWLNENIPLLAPHLRTVAPGWAYQPKYAAKTCRNQKAYGDKTCGDPDGWEGDPTQRKELEDVTDLTNGHAYGSSYSDDRGGSFVENMRTFGGASDGLAKPMLNTEYGTSDAHRDVPAYGASPKTSQAAAFDRIMRAHIGYADLFTQHAAFYEGFSLFETGYYLGDRNPAEMVKFSFSPDGGDTRVDVTRRLNLAYATHGRPLTYRVTNAPDLYDKLVYFRAVDTSSLEPLPGSGAASDKILLSFVNFEKTVQTMSVQVTMPESAVYEGERFGAGNTYEEARSYRKDLKAAPELTFKETLGPGEAVQIILTRSDAVRPQAPGWIAATPVNNHAIRVDWSESEGATAYDVLRQDNATGLFRVIARSVRKTHLLDEDTAAGSTYRYFVNVAGTTANSGVAQATATDTPALDRSGWTASADKGKAGSAIDANPYSRWDTGGNQVPDQTFRLDMKQAATINRIVLDVSRSPYDYPRKYEVYVSLDGIIWSGPVVSGAGAGAVTNISFPPQAGRYVKIVQTARAGNYWSIHDLNVYGTPPE